MGVIQRVVKPKKQRSKRALEEREPKAIENTKTVLFVRGVKCGENVVKCMKDICTLKKPNSTFYSKKNDIRPFEDATKLEFFSQKNDCSLFLFGNHNKKRPNNMIMGRMYDHHLLDMVELGLDSFTALSDFKNSKVALGTKPCLSFSGEPFADTTNLEMQGLKSLLMDFFRGPEVTNVRLAGIEHSLQFTAVDNKILMRSYKMIMKKSGTRVPRIELEEIGPRIEWSLRRTHLASEDLMKTAVKAVKNVHKTKKVKNIDQDAFGTTMGRVHVPGQEIKKLQTRKMKGLKETKEEKREKVKKKKEKVEGARLKAVAEVFGGEEGD